MIIKEITIYGYGKWVDQHFDLHAPVQVFYGPNEAGKSTMIDFIMAMLFGFQNKRQAVHGQYLPKNSNAYGGELVFEEQETAYRLTRTAGTHGGKVTFYDLTNDTALTPDDFHELLNPIDRSLYSSFFYFGEMDQQAFYKMSIEDLRWRIQQIGISDASAWFDLQTSLQKRADELYTPRGRKPIINQQLKEYDSLMKKVEAARDQYPQYESQSRELTELREQSQLTDTKIVKLQADIQKRQRWEQTAPLLKRKEQVQRQLATITPQLVAPAELETMQALHTEINNGQLQLRELTKQKVTGNDDAEFVSFWETNQARIDRLAGELNDNLDVNSQSELLKRNLAEDEDRVQQQLGELGVDANNVPTPFETDRLGEISRVINDATGETRTQRQPTESTETNVGPVIAGGIGGLLLLVGIFGRLTWLVVLSVLALIGAGVWWWRTKQPTVDFPAAESSKQQLDEIRRRYHLGEIPVTNWLAIQTTIQQLHELQSKIQRQQKQVVDLNQRVLDYLNQWTFASPWMALDAASSTGQLQQVQTTLTNWQSQQTVIQQRQEQQAQLADQVNQKQKKISETQVSLQSLLDQHGIQDGSELVEKAELRQEYNQLTKQLQLVEEQLKSLPTSDDEQEADVPQLADLQAALATEQQNGNQQSKQLTSIQANVDRLVHDGTYYDLRQQQANLQAEINANVVKWMGYQTALNWLATTMNMITKGRVPRVLELTAKYFGILTEQRYGKIMFEDTITVAQNDGTIFEINELSRGTLEQLYLSLVLALAIGFHEEFALPIIIDDGFVNFDGNRKKAASELIKEIGKQNQVLFYTADVNQLEAFQEAEIIRLK